MLSALLATLVAGNVLTACSSDDTPSADSHKIEGGKTYMMTVKASKGGEEAGDASGRRALALDGSTIKATWATTEKVFVKYGENRFTGSLSPDANAATATLNGSISADVDVPLPEDLTLQFPRQDMDYTGQVGTLADIAAKYDYATATAHIDQISGSGISATSPVVFTNQQAIVRFNLQNTDGAALNANSLRISATGLKKNGRETGDITITPAAATNEMFAALSGISSAQVTLTATVGSDTYLFRRNNVSFAHGQFHNITVKMHQVTYPITLTAVTSEDYIGSVVGQNGQVYATPTAASTAGTTAVAMIAYVGSIAAVGDNEPGCTHGLAIALTDDAENNQAGAITTAAGHTAVSGGSWRLPSLKDWQYMVIGCSGATYNAGATSIDYTGLNAKLATMGTALKNEGYWSNNPDNSPTFNGTMVDLTDTREATLTANVRACLAF